MDYLIGFVLGAVVTIILLRLAKRLRLQSEPEDDKQPSGQAAAPEPRPSFGEEDRLLPDQAKLYAIAADLHAFFGQSAQPSELIEHPDFVRGVELLNSADYSSERLLEYYTGDNQILSCLALEALCQRRDETELLDGILAHVNDVGYWARFFALRTLDLRVSEPLLVRVLSHVDDSWEGRIPEQVLKNFIEKRAPKEAWPTVDDLRARASDEQLEFLEEYLEDLGIELTDHLARKIKRWRDSHTDKHLLRSIGRLWAESAQDNKESIVEDESLTQSLPQLESCLIEEPRRSILVVGESGVGKSTLLKLLARRLRDQGWVVFAASASELLAGKTYIGELEQRIKDLIAQLGAKKKVLWIVPEFHNLLWAGRHRYSPTGVLELLLPSIESGEIAVAAEVSPESYETLTRSLPRIRSAFDICRMEAPWDAQTLELAREWLLRWGELEDPSPEHDVVSDEVLHEAFQLAKQYLGDQAAPGNLLGLLKLTLQRLSVVHASGELRVTTSDLVASLAHLTGLPSSILDDREQLELPGLHEFFQKRVLGQPEAVECLVERLAMIKAGLTDPTRPLGVFLFAGPTGTGKTEIAKTLTEFLFGSVDRMIRLDMSEFNTRDSISGILGDDDEHARDTALVRRIRHQPFSVILLDEFEKADPMIWDLFLQIFDDGRLTDKRGNTADFRHSIIVMTTNLGGDVAGAATIGFADAGDLAVDRGVEKAVKEGFRAEFVNRIDRIVTFRPLDRSTMREILYKELDLVLQRRGLRNRSWAVEWEDSAIDFLLARGFDRNLGARPLKRAIERYLLSPLAITIVNHQFPDGDQFLFVRSDGRKIVVEFIDPDAPDENAVDARDVSESDQKLSLGSIALGAHGRFAELEFLRRRYRELETLLDAEPWKSRKESYLGQLSSADFWNSPERFRVLGQAEYMDRIEAGLGTAGSLIRRLSDLSPKKGKRLSTDLMKRLAQHIYLLDEACSGLASDRPRDAFLLVRASTSAGADPALRDEFSRKLGKMYQRWSAKRRMDVQVLREETARSEPYSILMAVSGYAAFTILEREAGLHVLEVPGSTKPVERIKVRVRVVPQPETPPGPGAGNLLQQAVSELDRDREDTTTIVRSYREKPSPLIRDSLGQWRTGKLRRVLDGDFDLMGR